MPKNNLIAATLLLVVSCGLPVSLSAQTVPNQIDPGNASGIQPYNTYGGTRENINYMNGNLNLQIPLLSLPGRNGLDLNVSLVYDSKIWTLFGDYEPFPVDYTEYAWQYEAIGYRLGSVGWRLNIPYIYSELKSDGYSTWRASYAVLLPDGSKHSFSNGVTFGFPTVSDSQDGAFLRLDTTNQSDIVLYLKNGTRIHFPAPFGLPSQIVDTNGNKITFQGSVGNLTITDTVGREVTLTGTTLSYKDSNGQAQSINFSYSTVYLAPTFQEPHTDPGYDIYVFQPTPGNRSLLGGITLPNGLTHSFAYNTYGELTKITYPTGGYTAYSYSGYGEHQHYRKDWSTSYLDTPADFREVVERRVCQDADGVCGAGEEAVTTYTPTINGGHFGQNTNNFRMDVRDPEGDRMRSTFSMANRFGASPRELSREVYQGESTLLRTVQTDYSDDPIENWSLPIRVTTTFNDTNQVSKIEWTYDTYDADIVNAIGQPATVTRPIDNPTEKRAYDYGSGAPGVLVRKIGYVWLKTNAVNGIDYFYGTNRIRNRKILATVYTGSGVLKARTRYEYDNFTETRSPSGAVQKRYRAYPGNLTAVKHWRNTPSATWLITRHQYDDAGNIRKTTDPLGHETIFSYADSWGNSTCSPSGGNAAAYLTSTTNSLGHVASGTYNSCSGTVASTTDPNSQTTYFSYDQMNRLVQTDLPGGGQTTRTYNEAAKPLSVTTTTKITSSINRVNTTVVDGLGRLKESRLGSDPEGVVYTESTYDSLGRKETVTNPYRSTGDPTYGLTEFEYDVLGRVTKIIPPDGTASSNNVTTVYSGNSITVTDQQGKQRKSESDALGRLIQVDEPSSSGTAATPGEGWAQVAGAVQSTFVSGSPGAGWAAVSGNLQSTEDPNAPATSGTGWTRVDGTLQSTQLEIEPATPGTGWAAVSGTLQSTQVETQPATPGTGWVSVSGSLQSFEDPGEPATSGTGSVTFYGSPICDGGMFAAAATLAPQCDRGTIYVTVNSFTKSVSYNEYSTTSGLASTLASRFNSDGNSPVTASASGPTVTLTANQTGASTNYPLSTSVTQAYPAGFPDPAFNAVPSGPTLTGGSDGVPPQTIYDSGTVEVMVNGQTKSASYGQGSTASSIATALRSAINGDGNYPVIASGTGTTINLTAKTSGASTNYPLSVSWTWDTANFASPSFTATKSGNALTGGQDAQYLTVYDSGTVSITVNSLTKTANYGQGSTASSIASALRSAINGDANYPVTASGTGTTVNLTAKTSGASTNYPLSVSWTWDTSNFASPSFSATKSGNNLTGGSDGQYQTVYDSGTVWITVDAFTATANYSQGSTNSSIASDLANNFNTDPASPVTAAVSPSNQVNLTSKTTGASTNYSLTAGTTYDTGNFSSPSFTPVPSGSALTGGADAGVLYDSGTVTVTVDTFQAAVNYGQGSTNSSIASDLANIFNTDPGSPVTATVSPSNQVNLTSKTTGASTNYSLAVSWTWDAANFASASFTATKSGSTLTGGTDGYTLYDSGTVSITVNGLTKTASYSQGSSASSLASALRNFINNDGNYPVTAGGSGTTLTLTSKTTGASTNYSLAVSWTWDTANFASASFTATKSGSTLTGGADASTPSLNLSTYYTYDALYNLTRVQQGDRDDRVFTYNSLSQLLSAYNPESGTVNYAYDNEGNLTSKSDARSITTTYAYDALHRLAGKSYSDSTPAVAYIYDQAHYNGLNTGFGIGRRVGMQDDAGKQAWSYDVRGRVVTDKRKTSNKTKVFDYAYNLNGSVQSITYPSGQRVDYSYNAAGRAVSATDVGSGTQLATQALYAPHGAPVNLQTGVGGGFAGYSRTWSYNERLQPVTIVAASPTQTLLDLTYDFGLGVANNGNVKLIFNNLNGERTQSFSYDGLNRIETASVPTDWGLSYAYDRYGNLLDKTVTQGGGPTALHVTVNTKNRINSGGFSYDVAGNLTNYSGQTYAYDAENRMTSAAGVSYTYDGDGRRVKKSNGTLYWYGIAGEVLVESQLNGTLKDEYVFFNGQRVARRKASGEVNYYFSDHLGSSRVVTNDAGQILDDADFYPFGGERIYTSTSGNNYKFTGQERDAESGLDYFRARMYANNLGRFLSSDPLLNSGRPWQPQSWNRYSYTSNNPLKFVDPFGLYEFVPSNCTLDDKKCHKKARKDRNRFRRALNRLEDAIKKFKPGSKERERLEAARKAYGKEGEKNGVFVAFGELEGDTAGNLQTHSDEQGNLSFTITFDLSKVSGSNEFGIAAGHEGTHISDSLSPFRNSLSDFSVEYRAYQTSAWAAQGLGIPTYTLKGGYVIWNSSWREVDRQTLMDHGITRFVVERRRFTETVPHNPVDPQ